MPSLVPHNAALAAKREALAAAQSAALVRPAGGYGAHALGTPDPNAPAARAAKIRQLQELVRAREEERRRRSGETVKPFSRKKNYYDRLGLARDCSAAEVRRAFRRLSLRCHPDKQLGKSEEERAEAAVRFRELVRMRTSDGLHSFRCFWRDNGLWLHESWITDISLAVLFLSHNSIHTYVQQQRSPAARTARAPNLQQFGGG
jgi:hypothetical protein